MSEELKEELFAVNSPATLHLENIRGTVHVRAENRDTIQVKATKFTDTGDEENTLLIFEQVNGSTVRIATRVQNPILTGLKRNQVRACRVKYEVLAPEDCSLKLECVSASAEILGLRGDHNLNLVSGDLSAQDLQGKINIHSVSGNTLAQGFTGSLHISSVSGDISLEALEPETLRLHTVSGDIRIETDTIPDKSSIETISGDIELGLSSGAAFTLNMTTLSGDVHSDLPAVCRSRQIGRKVYEIQGGGPTLQLKSLSGDLHIRDKTTAAQIYAGELSPTVDSMAILDQLANGELSVEGAINALQE